MIIVAGPLPPPMCGLSNITYQFSIRVLEQYSDLVICNTSPPSLGHKDLFKAVRITLSYIRAYIKVLINIQKSSLLYLPVNAGFGVIFTLFVTLTARLFNVKCLLHHHSYSYINNFSLALYALCHINPSAHHIFLGFSMRDKFTTTYTPVNSFVLSNAYFVKPEGYLDEYQDKSDKSIHSILFLSNITVEKGVDLALEVASRAWKAKLSFFFTFAGPFLSPSDKSKYLQYFQIYPNIKYIGAVSSQEKVDLFSQSDFLIFPTKYRNEAEPLVLLEAMSNGCIPITLDRGLIQEILPPFIPLFNNPITFVDDSLRYISSIKSISELKSKVYSHYISIYSSSQLQSQSLYRLLNSIK